VELPEEIYEMICELSAQGNLLAEGGSFHEALSLFQRAWNLLPDPTITWEAATWLLAAIGDIQFLLGDYNATRETLSMAMHAPGAIGNPFLHLRLGQAQFELGDQERAADELTRAFLLEGSQIFTNDDPKYLSFIKSKLRPPEGGWPRDW
jgi:tetratricopeptide (TPR) repeat protein